MKKGLIAIITILLLILLLTVLFFVKSLNNKYEESMPNLEDLGTMQENTINSEEVFENKTDKNESSTKISNKNVIKRVVKKVQNKLSHEKEQPEVKKNVEEIQQSQIIEETVNNVVSEEEEALKKIPRSEEVVVDKEIKSKSSRKYVFK